MRIYTHILPNVDKLKFQKTKAKNKLKSKMKNLDLTQTMRITHSKQTKYKHKMDLFFDELKSKT